MHARVPEPGVVRREGRVDGEERRAVERAQERGVVRVAKRCRVGPREPLNFPSAAKSALPPSQTT